MGEHVSHNMFRAAIAGGFLVTSVASPARAQIAAHRVRSDAYTYMFVEYGGVFGNQVYRGPGFGGGARAELESMGIDVSASLLACSHTRGQSTAACEASGWDPISAQATVQGLYFPGRSIDAGPYVGGGLGWSGTAFSNYVVSSSTKWRGSGLHAKLTLGYELSRRVFIQGDAVLPFYQLTGERVSYSRSARGTVLSPQRRRAPSLNVSIGLGFNAR
jgi:hypothetical protein